MHFTADFIIYIVVGLRINLVLGLIIYNVGGLRINRYVDG